jgi:hypothetical protein
VKTSNRFGVALASIGPSKTVRANCVSYRQTQTAAKTIFLHFRCLFRTSFMGALVKREVPQQIDERRRLI